MESNMHYRTVGIGSIKITMHDGIVKTLDNIRHIAVLKKNDFFGHLDSMATNV